MDLNQQYLERIFLFDVGEFLYVTVPEFKAHFLRNGTWNLRIHALGPDTILLLFRAVMNRRS